MAVLAQIVSAGAYVPRLRLPRAVIAASMGWLDSSPSRAGGARSACNWDEDALTLAIEAARGALRRMSAPHALHLASTSLPFADRSNAALAAACLDLPTAIETLESTGSLRAGTAALANAARRSGSTLVVASDARLAKPGSAQEMRMGHGAAALLVHAGGAPASESGTPTLAEILAAAHVAADFVDHYRMAGEEFDYWLEERWIRDEALQRLPAQAIAAALHAAGITAAEVAHFAMPGPASVARRVANDAGLAQAALADALEADCGDTGSAHPLLMLLGALERAREGDLILLLGLGQGVDAIVLRAGAALAAWRAGSGPLTATLARRRDEPSYTRFLSQAGLLDVDFGMRAERDNRTAHSVAWRKHDIIDAFRGGRCRDCGTVQFPRSRVCVNPDCRRTDSQDIYRLADSTGTVKTFTEDWLAYSRRPPYVYGNVSFAEGGNLLMELTDLDAGELAVGDRVRFVLRIKDHDPLRRFRRYFWKAVRV
jgi:3-hydroxy-3-methylglutaryl CoA synthase